MSIDRCSKCGSAVDTDNDTEFYGENGNGFKGYESLCETCRDEEIIEVEMEEIPREFYAAHRYFGVNPKDFL